MNTNTMKNKYLFLRGNVSHQGREVKEKTKTISFKILATTLSTPHIARICI